MTCEEMRKELSVSPVQSVAGASAHLAACESCRAWQAGLGVLENRLSDWRGDSPSAGLQTRIAARLAGPERSSWKTYISLWKENTAVRRFSFVVAAGFVAAGVLIFFVNGQAASAFAHMKLAVSKVQNAHMIVWYNIAKSGPVDIQKVEEVWYQDHCWRKRYGDRTDNDRIIRGSNYYVYDPAQNKVVSSGESADQSIDFSLQALAGSYMPLGAKPHAQWMGTSMENGKTVREIDLDLSSQGERMLFWVDQSTGLPIRAEKQDMDYHTGQWNVDGRFEFEFNQSLPASLFDPHSLAHQ
ncbi:MAG TPA: hypothetical protein VFW40_02575 [Capsulimonadaceae bacterium]|nr:hypothetical protein [Capsulimonadaceae bacterium]